MICQPCRDAADLRAPASEHCGGAPGPGAPCDCQHRTDRYRPAPETDTCRVIDVDGEPIRLHGSGALTEEGVAAVGDVIAAARRHLETHPPVVPDDDGTESELTRRIRAQQRGVITEA
ncbi:hypothetical protein PV350_04875 [Streptomyces sp. PA03-6a]|nr:hypothetical protein [Streptomyces sp. PA03-6a]